MDGHSADANFTGSAWLGIIGSNGLQNYVLVL